MSKQSAQNHPIINILDHDKTVFGEEIDGKFRRLAKLAGSEVAIEVYDTHRSGPDLVMLAVRLDQRLCREKRAKRKK